MNDIQLPLAIEEIIIGEGRREVNAAAVKRLAESIEKVGLRHPITVRERGDKYQLIAGMHRIEACKRLGRDFVPATIVKMTNDDARLWEISENLHRADLSKIERDENVAEWIKITDRISSQVDRKVGRPEGGVEAAARELGVDRMDAHRAVKVASLSNEAKDAAREHHLDNNRSALLEAARETEPEKQVAKIVRIAAVKLADAPLNDFESKEKQVAALTSAWNKAGTEAREEFLSRIDKPLMDKRYG